MIFDFLFREHTGKGSGLGLVSHFHLVFSKE